MKFFLFMSGRVAGPYEPPEISELFGNLPADALVCTEFEHEGGNPQWRKAAHFPGLGVCPGASGLRSVAPSEPARSLRLNILSTDDDSNIRSLLWNMLSDAGHNVEFAKDGEEVFRRLAAKKYDLVILDVNMPKMNGYKVSELLHGKLANPPKVIIFTGRDLEQEKLQFVCSGADAILNKGTGSEKLMETIDSLFRQRPAAAAVFTPEPPPRGIEMLSLTAALTPEPPPLPAEPAVPPVASSAVKMLPRPVAGADAALAALLQEVKSLNVGLVDARRILGHLEREYTQVEGQFEKLAAKALEANRLVAQKLEGDWRKFKNTLLLIILFLMLPLLFALV